MTRLDLINKAIKDSLKEKESVYAQHRSFLRLLKGEIESAQIRQVKALEDSQQINILKKILKANQETIIHLPKDDTRIPILHEENSILGEFIPEDISDENLTQILAQKQQEILSAKSPGQAIGVAMRFLKEKGVSADGNQVKLVVESIRSL